MFGCHVAAIKQYVKKLTHVDIHNQFAEITGGYKIVDDKSPACDSIDFAQYEVDAPIHNTNALIYKIKYMVYTK